MTKSNCALFCDKNDPVLTHLGTPRRRHKNAMPPTMQSRDRQADTRARGLRPALRSVRRDGGHQGRRAGAPRQGRGEQRPGLTRAGAGLRHPACGSQDQAAPRRSPALKERPLPPRSPLPRPLHPQTPASLLLSRVPQRQPAPLRTRMHKYSCTGSMPLQSMLDWERVPQGHEHDPPGGRVNAAVHACAGIPHITLRAQS